MFAVLEAIEINGFFCNLLIVRQPCKNNPDQVLLMVLAGEVFYQNLNNFYGGLD